MVTNTPKYRNAICKSSDLFYWLSYLKGMHISILWTQLRTHHRRGTRKQEEFALGTKTFRLVDAKRQNPISHPVNNLKKGATLLSTVSAILQKLILSLASTRFINDRNVYLSIINSHRPPWSSSPHIFGHTSSAPNPKPPLNFFSKRYGHLLRISRSPFWPLLVQPE